MSLRPHHEDEAVTLYHGDCVEVMRQLPDASVDAVVTDPPYELGFMGKGWDASGVAYSPEVWSNALRVLKPGGHLLAFGGTRTWYRLACAIEDAGFEVRDSIAWMYGSGFPKSLDVSKAIDKAAGVEREIGRVLRQDAPKGHAFAGDTYSEDGAERRVIYDTAPATPAAQQWQGWGTALKPAFEPIVVARKPLIGTVAANVLAHGTGALNIDGCRIEAKGRPLISGDGNGNSPDGIYGDGLNGSRNLGTTDLGRWPANVILDESQAAALDRMSGVTEARQSGWSKSGSKAGSNDSMSGDNYARDAKPDSFTDTGGGASRFFYTAKADSSERPRVDGVAHPTVKPLDLMRYLVRLVTPPGGVVLEPFAGSGTTLEACVIEGFRCIGIEREPDYLPLILARLTKPIEPVMF